MSMEEIVPAPVALGNVALLDSSRWSMPATKPKQKQTHGVPDNPLWIDAQEWAEPDRVTLRRALGDRYDVHGRGVTRLLAEQPGLRATGATADLVPELVALLAYHSDEQETINKQLRSGGSDDRGELVARAATRGLLRLPTVFGPVFATGRTAVWYRPGDELIEPAFLDVDTAGAPQADAAVEYVFWSISARRLPADSTTAAFPPGSRFSVLAVDSMANGRLRVLLADRAGGRPGVLERLRNASPGAMRNPLRHLSFSPGLDDQGRRYVKGAPS